MSSVWIVLGTTYGAFFLRITTPDHITRSTLDPRNSRREIESNLAPNQSHISLNRCSNRPRVLSIPIPFHLAVRACHESLSVTITTSTTNRTETEKMSGKYTTADISRHNTEGDGLLFSLFLFLANFERCLTRRVPRSRSGLVSFQSTPDNSTTNFYYSGRWWNSMASNRRARLRFVWLRGKTYNGEG